MLITEEGLFS